jgi:hypothetical protein
VIVDSERQQSTEAVRKGVKVQVGLKLLEIGRKQLSQGSKIEIVKSIQFWLKQI